MNVPELALHHQRLEQRAERTRDRMGRLEAELAGDPAGDPRRDALAALEAAGRDLELRLRERDREVETHRARLKARERELMSGRIGNPGELVKLSQEVEHLRAAISVEEDRELELMEEQERGEAETARLREDLRSAQERAAAAAPDLRARLEAERAELASLEADREAAWAELPADWRRAYANLRERVANPVAEVAGGQCQACRVGVTSNGMQVLRRGGLVLCENCGRLQVVA